jgi:L-glutamine:2-deoxy-scyllo-inosose/3-amino-2,3-dideoxy-scyllo-inosose aminotransferase
LVEGGLLVSDVRSSRRLALDWPIFGEEETAALRQVVTSGVWGHADRSGYVGHFEPKFERAFADFQTASHGLCVANGTVALQLALEALEIGFGDEVVVPGLTWQATAGAVLDVNAEPVLVDVDPDTYCIDPAAVEAAVTPRTKAVIAVHLYNCLADLDRLAEIAERHGIYLIEDCAHSHGSAWRGRGVGSVGAIGCFSFQSSKSLTAGEGGFCTTGSDELKSRIESLRTCGRRPIDADECWRPAQSGNYRLSEWQAAVLWTQFQRFPKQLELREANAKNLDDAITEIAGVRAMSCPPEVSRRGMYAYVFRYDAEPFSGLPASGFRSALAAKLGIPVDSTYEPLRASPLFQPQTKPRHHLNGDYWARIDPSRFALPVAERAYREEAVVIPHEVLLNDWETLRQLPEAIATIQAEAEAGQHLDAAATAKVGAR